MKMKKSLAVFLACLTIAGTGMTTASYTASAETDIEQVQLAATATTR